MQNLQTLLNAAQHESHVRVDLDRYARNISILKALTGPQRELMAVVKADAYGHGAVVCAPVALQHGATWLAVARLWEGVQLRQSGVSAPILLLGGPNLEALAVSVDHDLTLSIGTEHAADAVIALAAQCAKPVRVHLKVDTGLHRYGALPDLARQLGRRLHAADNVVLEGIYGHFSSSDELDEAPTLQQIQRAELVINQLVEDGIAFKYIHLPNSAATITGMTSRSNLLRAGIATYGLAPSSDVPLPEGMLPVLSVRSSLTRRFVLEPGEGVSYGLTYRADTSELAGTVPIGYADGLPRSISGEGWFVVDGERCPVLGRVCMDQTVVGLPTDTSIDSTVQVIGDSSDGAMTLDDIAELDGTINYEIATRMSARMPRVFVSGGEAIRCEIKSLHSNEQRRQ